MKHKIITTSKARLIVVDLPEGAGKYQYFGKFGIEYSYCVLGIEKW